MSQDISGYYELVKYEVNELNEINEKGAPTLERNGTVQVVFA